MMLISSINAVMRFWLGLSSNVCSRSSGIYSAPCFSWPPVTPSIHNGRVHIDAIHGWRAPHTQEWIDFLGTALCPLQLSRSRRSCRGPRYLATILT